MSSTVETAADIRPFHVDIPEEQLAELRRRIEATRLPSKELVEDRSQGYSWPRFRSSRSTGQPTTTGARPRPS